MKNGSLKNNLIYQVTYQILILILPFITSPYLARVIGAEGVGIYSYSYTVANYFVLFAMLGIANYGNRLIAQNRDDRSKLDVAFSGLLILHLIISCICLIVYTVYASLAENNQIALIQTMHVLSALFDISWFYFGIEKFKLTVTRSTIIRVCTCILIFLIVKERGDLWKYCIIMSLGTLLSQIALWIPLNKYVSIRRISWQDIVIHLKPMAVLFLPAIAVSLYKFMDKIMIGTLSNKIQLGLYENAEKLISIPSSIIQSFGIVLLPKMSNLFSKDDNREVYKYIDISMKYIMWLVVGLGMGTAAIANTFAPVFWGEEFTGSGAIIMGLAISIPFFSFANIIRTQYLIPRGKDKEYTISVFAGAVVNIIINALLITAYGGMGAMIGTVIAEATVCIIQAMVVKNELPINIYIKRTLPYLCIGFIMFTAVLCIGLVWKATVITLIIEVIMGAVVYSGLSFFYFLYKKDEILYGLIRKSKS